MTTPRPYDETLCRALIRSYFFEPVDAVFLAIAMRLEFRWPVTVAMIEREWKRIEQEFPLVTVTGERPRDGYDMAPERRAFCKRMLQCL